MLSSPPGGPRDAAWVDLLVRCWCGRLKTGCRSGGTPTWCSAEPCRMQLRDGKLVRQAARFARFFKSAEKCGGSVHATGPRRNHQSLRHHEVSTRSSVAALLRCADLAVIVANGYIIVEARALQLCLLAMPVLIVLYQISMYPGRW